LAKTRKSSPGKAKTKPYNHPIPDRNSILEYLRDIGQPRKADAILKDFGIKGVRGREQLLDKLNAMVRAGQVIQNRGGEYCLSEKLDLISGTVSAHKDGFGFVVADQGGDDIYLSAREMRSLFHGDRVAIKISGADRRGRPAGKLVEVLERRTIEVRAIYSGARHRPGDSGQSQNRASYSHSERGGGQCEAGPGGGR